MSKSRQIDLTGNISRLRQIALNHAVTVVSPNVHGSTAAHEVISCAEQLLGWMLAPHKDHLPADASDGG